MTVITVKTKTKSYPIYVGSDFHETLHELTQDKKVAIITDDNVAGVLHPIDKAFLNPVNKSSLHPGACPRGPFLTADLVITLPAGESSKSLTYFEYIITQLIENEFTRHDILIALGGGVIGDLTGFVAASYQRGMPFIQVPTTLLSQVDSSVGGKTAVNHPLAKNMIGAFYQPEAVFIDINTLETLPEREFNAGMAEVIKYGLIADKDFFYWLIKYQENIKSKEKTVLIDMIKRCCEIKAQIVSQDEDDKGVRQTLNFGHTFGHAIETGLNYQYLHGEAVAIGMVEASKISLSMGNIKQQAFDDIIKLLQFFNLPTTWPKNLPKDKAVSIMQYDKKNKASDITIVLMETVGKAVLSKLNKGELWPHKVL